MCERAWERQLACAVADAGRQPALLLVSGAAGMGKSTLVRKLLESPQARAVTRLVASFRASGKVSVAGPVSPDSPAAAGRVRANPSTDAVPAGVGPASCQALEASLASVRPVLLVAEDVHHADDHCLRLLRGLLAEPPERFAAVLTYRPGQLARAGLPLGGAVDYPAHLSVTRRDLEPLDEQQVRGVAGELLGAQRCPRDFVARLHRRSGGIPQVLVDLLRTLRDTGGDREHFRAGDVDEAGVPVRLAESVHERTGALPDQYRPIVWAAAVLGEAASAQELSTVAGLCEDGGHEALVAALECSSLRETEQGRYGFAVPLEASVVYDELPGPVRERMHHRAAAMLAVREPVSWARIAQHWRGGGRTADWLRAAERVAECDGSVSEDEAAVALLEQVLGVGGLPPEKRGRLALTLARGAVLGLRSEGTVQVLRRVVEDPTLPATARGEIRLELGLLLHNQKRCFDEGRAELRRAAVELAVQPALAARAMAALANPFFPGASLEENLRWLLRAEEAAAASRDGTARTAVDACRATVLMNAGDPEAWRLVRGLPRKCTGRADRQQVARGLCNTANGAVYLGHYRRADELLQEGVELAARSGAPFLERVGRGTALFRDWLTGRWDGLAERCTGLVAEEGTASDARVVLALLALAKGEWATAQNWLPRSDATPETSEAAPLAATAAGARIRLLLARQNVESASSAATSAWEWLGRKGVWVWGAELAPWAVEAHVRAKAPQSARDLVAEFAAGLQGRDAPSASAALLWCQAVVAESEGDLGGALKGFREAADAYSRLPHPYAQALMTECAGRCALLLGSEVDEAVRELSACVQQLTDLGAVWDATRVRAMLRAHLPAAQRRPPGRPSYAERMSPREEEVADLAATGLTNREIAATLHLSPRTVEQHIARAMRKLGVNSRQGLAELAARVGTGRDDDKAARTV